MKVSDLIEELKNMPHDARVGHLWDGVVRTEINHVYLSNSGWVVTADNDHVCYNDDDRPIGAPTVHENRYWHTPKDQSDIDDL